MTPEGTHLLLDFHGATDPGDRALSILRGIAQMPQCDIMKEAEHVFPGGGRTALLLLSASHASIHTWPEHRYVSVDLYSCKVLSRDQVNLIKMYAKTELRSSGEEMREVLRGHPL